MKKSIITCVLAASCAALSETAEVRLIRMVGGNRMTETRSAELERVDGTTFRFRWAKENLSDDVASMIRAVGAAGYVPLVKYVPYRWSDDRSPAQMADYLCRRYFEESDWERLYESALAAAEELAGDAGILRDAVNTTVAWIWWKT